jgi:hypothetical protein
VLEHAEEIRDLIGRAVQKEEDNKRAKPHVYGEQYHMYRASSSFFHLRCQDPIHVAQQFRARAGMFDEYARRAPGNSASLNQADLIRIYLANVT